MNWMEAVEKPQLQKKSPDFKVGDTVKVSFRTQEGGKERIQHLEGIVIERRHSGTRETFTLRRLSEGIGVERTFPLASPRLEKVEVQKTGKVRRAKLYYLREKIGKEAKIKEKKG